MKKRKFVSFCLIFILSFLPWSKCMADTKLESLDNLVHFTNNVTDSGNEDTIDQIKPLIENYFNWYNKNMKDNLENFDEIDSLVNNDNLINLKKSKVKWYHNFHKELDVDLKSYTVTIDLNNIDKDGKYINADITYSEKLITENAEDFTQDTYNQEHNLIIENNNNKYVIINDYYSDELMDEEFSHNSEVYSSVKSVDENDNSIEASIINDKNVNIKMEEKEEEFKEKLVNLDLEVKKVRG